MTTPEKIKSKIFDIETLQRKINGWRFKSKKIVFTNGCFDILHLGHIDYLTKAADAGDVLIVAVNTDTSVSRLKGNDRPINNELQRTTILASLSFVDAVILFDEQTPYELIKIIQPDVLVKGSDYKAEDIIGYDIVKDRGGLVTTIKLLAGYSTTLTEKKIKSAKI